MRYLSILIVAFVLSGCSHAPPTLSPVGARYWAGNEAVIALGTMQRAAIEMNKINYCDPPEPGASGPECRLLLSTANTGHVVDAVTIALTTMKAVPDGWRATSLAALDTIQNRLDPWGRSKFGTYLQAARAILGAIGGQ